MRDHDMPSANYSPTISKLILARKMVAARDASRLTNSAASKALGWSTAKLSTLENAAVVRPSSDDVLDLCELYGIEGTERDALIDLARNARQRGWWRRYDDVFRNEFPGVEAGASEIRTFQTTFVPGLLQSSAYIEMVTRTAGITDQAEVERHTAARLERQTILTRAENPARLHAVIDENALLRLTEPAVRGEQLRHILEIAERPNIDVRVLPTAAGLYPGAGETFHHLVFPGEQMRDIVYLETAIDDRMLEERDETDRYRVRFETLCSVALSPEATGAYLREQME